MRAYSRQVLQDYGDDEGDCESAYSAVDQDLAIWSARREDVEDCANDVNALVGAKKEWDEACQMLGPFDLVLDYLTDVQEQLPRLQDAITQRELLCQKV